MTEPQDQSEEGRMGILRKVQGRSLDTINNETTTEIRGERDNRTESPLREQPLRENSHN